MQTIGRPLMSLSLSSIWPGSLIEARIGAGLTQAQLAKRMKTSQSVVARLEGGRIHPSTRTLGKVAQATGTRLRISFESAGDTA